MRCIGVLLLALLAAGCGADESTTREGSGHWETRAPLPEPRQELGGRIYIVGGLNGDRHRAALAAGGQRGGQAVGDFSAYDPVADQWTTLPDLPTAREHLAGAAVGGQFYAIGGRAKSSRPRPPTMR